MAAEVLRNRHNFFAKTKIFSVFQIEAQEKADVTGQKGTTQEPSRKNRVCS